jgi:hypothetical protein
MQTLSDVRYAYNLITGVHMSNIIRVGSQVVLRNGKGSHGFVEAISGESAVISVYDLRGGHREYATVPMGTLKLVPCITKPDVQKVTPFVFESKNCSGTLVGIAEIRQLIPNFLQPTSGGILEDMYVLLFKTHDPDVIKSVYTTRGVATPEGDNSVILPKFFKKNSHIKSTAFRVFGGIDPRAAWVETQSVYDQETGELLDTHSVGAISPAMALGHLVTLTMVGGRKDKGRCEISGITGLTPAITTEEPTFFYNATNDEMISGDKSFVPNWIIERFKGGE